MIKLATFRQRGASYLEFAIAVSVICLLIGFALRGYFSASADTEKLKMEEFIGAIEQALFNVTAEHMVKTRLADLQRLENTNPVRLLRDPLPENYLGERGNRDEKPEPGSWYYNYDRQALVYRVEHHAHLITSDSGDELVFKLRFKFADSNMNRHFDSGTEEVYGLKLEATQPYEWVD